MELTARLLPQMIAMHKDGDINPMLDEAYRQKDYDSVGFLYQARRSKNFLYVAKFYMLHGWSLDLIESWHKTMLNSKMIKGV